MDETAIASRYTLGEEIANSVIHGIGAVLAIAGLAVLSAFASVFGNGWHIVSCSIFGATLVLLYTASTLYHGIQSPIAKKVLRLVDHTAIFLLIAGTYTPFTLVNLRGPWGWSLFGVVWCIAVLGVIFQVIFIDRWKILPVVIYVGMGWLIVAAIRPLLSALAAGGLVLLAGGGLCYTLGVVFYVSKKIPYHHAIWHLFVLAGSTLHFFAVLFYVIPISR
jgi:hemolysin III